MHEIRQFLGLCGYYRRYVQDYAKHASPLQELTKNDESYEWNVQRQEAFDFLKQALTTAPILAMSQDTGMFVLDVDASDSAVGAVLQQEQGNLLRVIGYSSRTFNACERKYCITRKELAVVVFGLKQYRQYLLGRHFLIRSDHVALTYLRSAKELIGQQARWLDFIEEFDFELQHRAGTSHGNADALSRKYSADDLERQPCSQCRKRGFYNEEYTDACQARGGALAVHQSHDYGDAYHMNDLSTPCVREAQIYDDIQYTAVYPSAQRAPSARHIECTVTNTLCVRMTPEVLPCAVSNDPSAETELKKIDGYVCD